MADPVVLITGAGPTGLVLAIWLTRLGVRVRIIDKAAEPGTTSRALAVQARTLELYHQMGLDRPVIEGGAKIRNLNFWVQGKKRASLTLERIGEGITPYPFALVFPQDAHERLLIARLREMGVEVERRVELVSFQQDDKGVRARLRGPDGSESTCNAQFLAGCDGASSQVREVLGIGFPGGTYTGLFYVADVDAAGPAVNRQLHVDVEEADFVLLFPLQGEGRIRLVGNVTNVPSGDGNLTFDDIRAKAIEHLQLTIRRIHWFSTYRVHHRVARRFREGRVFLLGDAAHIHSPVGGQGMNTGIADAINLAWKLAAVTGGDFPAALLDTYAEERVAFAKRLVATTDRVFTFVTRRGPLARFVRTRVAPVLLPVVFRLPPMRRFLFRTVSQTTTNYRDSALSEGAAGSVTAGDRLPWVRLKANEDNFAPLRTLHWQVHVYGEPSAALVEACADLEIAIHGFAWTPEMQHAGFARSAAYLIRPDGYVAFADKDADPERLRAYFETRGYRWS